MWRRDLRMVVDGLRGRSPSPLVKRGRSPQYAAVAVDSAAKARAVEVVEVIRETRDAVSLLLRDREPFVAGQFLTVMVPVGGEVLRRAYSISGTWEGGVRITVKRMGRASGWLVEEARVGMTLQVLGPSGEFTLVPESGRARHVVGIAGGSGITPIMAIARALLDGEPGSRMTLLYGNRTEDDVIFRRELERMAIDVRYAFGERMDFDVEDGDLFYVCGPEAMMKAAREALVARGVEAGRIKEERFSAPARRQTASVSSAQPVTIRRAGVAMDVIVPAGATILDAGLAAGVPMKLSCAMGGCGACAVTLTAGEVVMDEPNCLGEAERAKGRILACVARPVSPCTVEAHP